MLEDKLKFYRENRKYLKNNTPATYKKLFPFLRDVDSLALANTQIHLERAFSSFFNSLKKKEKQEKQERKFIFLRFSKV